MDKLTADDIRRIRAEMTWGDQSEASKLAGDDSDEMIKLAMHRAAVRIGLAPPSLAEFLDSVPMDALSEALNEDRKPTSPDSAT